MTAVKIFPSGDDALDDENLIRAVLTAYGWQLDIHYSDRRQDGMQFHRITAISYDTRYDVTAEWVCVDGRWSRRLTVHWHGNPTGYPWPLGDPPLDTILNTDDPVTSEADLAQLCGVIDLRVA